MVEESCEKIVQTMCMSIMQTTDVQTFLNELAFFNVITATVFVYVTLLSQAVMLIISEKTASCSHCGSSPISVLSRDYFC
jgi:hypothetical protein